MNLNKYPNSEKPRERLIKYGVENLSNEDLMSILIGTGTKNCNVKELSSIILSKINNIENLDELTISELTSIKGLGKAKALTIISAIELGKRVSNKTINERLKINNAKTINEYFSNLISYSKQEELLVILIDNKKRLISYKKMYKGTSNASYASPKEIFNYAIRERADAFVIMHNHPSGVVSPSMADQELTNTIIETGKIIGIPLLDHIITNGKEYYSFFEAHNEDKLS